MDSVDYIFIAIVLLSVLVGVFRGFIREALSLATWILAFFLALRFGPQAASYLRPAISSVPLRTLAADALVFFAVLLAGGLLTYLVSLAVRGSGLAPVDRMLGAGFGMLRGVFVVAAAVMLVGMTQWHQSQDWRHSRLAPRLQPLAEALHDLIPAQWLAHLQLPPAPLQRAAADKAPAPKVDK